MRSTAASSNSLRLKEPKGIAFPRIVQTHGIFVYKGKREMVRKLEVVVVDDEEQITELLRTFMLYINKEIQIHEFNDSLVAKEFIDHNPVDVIITDFKMPRFDGMQLLESAPASVRKIVISGDDSWIDPKKLQSLNATFFEKPVPLRALAKVINELQESIR
jgi:two-component system response regulator YesN